MQESGDIKIWLQVVRAYQKTGRRLSERLRELELSTAQLDVLANLHRRPEGLTQTELGNKLLSTRGNVTGLVERLLARGLVERCVNPDDARSKKVSLTAEGRVVAGQACALYSAFVAEMMSVLSVDDRASLADIMARVEAQLDAMD